MLTTKNHAEWQYWIDEPEFLMAQCAVIKHRIVHLRKLNASALLTKCVLEHRGLEEHVHVLKNFWY